MARRKTPTTTVVLGLGTFTFPFVAGLDKRYVRPELVHDVDQLFRAMERIPVGRRVAVIDQSRMTENQIDYLRARCAAVVLIDPDTVPQSAYGTEPDAFVPLPDTRNVFAVPARNAFSFGDSLRRIAEVANFSYSPGP